MPGSDYAEVLIPPDNKGNLQRVLLSKNPRKDKQDWTMKLLGIGICLILATLLLGILALVLRYESKIMENEGRIAEVEADLETFFTVLEEELGHENGWKVLGQEIEDLHEKKENSPENPSSNPKPRNKRQVASTPVQFPNLPNSFGEGVQRTEDGVPIVDRSYQVSAVRGSSGGSRRFENIVAAQPTPDSEGLRLYEGLVETGGRNEPKSPDFEGTQGLSPLLPHHKVSAAWSEKQENSNLRSRLQLRSGDEGGLYDDRYGGPRFANEFTYRRSKPQLRSRQYQYPPLDPTAATRRVRKRPGVGATYHRNSRVALTPEAETPPTRNRGRWASSSRRRTDMEYPPLRRMSLGEGQGEVIARVIQDNDQGYYGGGRKTGGLRTQQRQQTHQYLQSRPVETRRQRPPATSTENPAGYSWGRGPLNVTINRSQPFQTYYSSSNRNWEVQTERPTPVYRNRYY